MYLVNTRPDICYAINQLSQAMVKPTKLFWKAGKHVLHYLRGTLGYGLWYRQEDEVKLCGFTNANWVGSPIDRKSTSGGIFSIGSTTISWYSRKQRSVALSSVEAEYMAKVWLHTRLYGWGRSWSGCSGHTWSLLWFIVITRVALNSWLIQYFMIDPSTSTSCTIISEIVCSEESCYFNTFPRRIRMLISWRRCSPGVNLNTTEVG